MYKCGTTALQLIIRRGPFPESDGVQGALLVLNLLVVLGRGVLAVDPVAVPGVRHAQPGEQLHPLGTHLARHSLFQCLHCS